MARKPTTTRPTTSITVDFTGVEGGMKVIPEGDYLVEVVEVEQKQKPGSEYPYLSWKFKVAEGEDHAGTILYYNTSFNPNSLWNLRNLLEALGVDVPSGPLEIDLTDLVELQVMGVSAHDTYEGKKKSTLVDFYLAEDATEEVVDEEDPAPEASSQSVTKAATTKAPKKSVLEKLKGDEVAEFSEEELEGVIEKYSLELDLSELKTLRKKQNAVIDALEEKGFIEEE